ncbi:MAG: endonuclease [Bacteriovoracaceae bacterium]|nr:endonuclease [Bacteriovoracaceae bacterium]
MKVLQITLICLLLNFCLTSKSHANLSRDQLNQLSNLSLEDLKSRLNAIVSASHDSMGYDRAKKAIFEKIDNHQGQVCCVYSRNNCKKLSKVPSHKIMNIEHTWPQSLGARGTAKSDLHHLYPTTSSINSTRSNFPFCEVRTIKWQGDGSKMGKDRAGTICFEPPARHKGDVARAMFYFSIRYKYQIDRMQEDVLRKWHHQDPVDSDELERHRLITNYQHNINVFIENPELVDEVTNF